MTQELLGSHSSPHRLNFSSSPKINPKPALNFSSSPKIMLKPGLNFS